MLLHNIMILRNIIILHGIMIYICTDVVSQNSPIVKNSAEVRMVRLVGELLPNVMSGLEEHWALLVMVVVMVVMVVVLMIMEMIMEMMDTGDGGGGGWH